MTAPKVPTRVLSVTAALAVLALGMVIREQLPAAQELMDQPFIHTTTAPTFGTIRDPRPQVGTELNGIKTHGLWLVVEFPFTPAAHNVLVTGTLTAADGRTFDAANSFRQPCGTLYPGLETTCALAFEVPADALPGVTLTLSPGQQQMAAHLVRDLGLDDGAAERLRAAAGPLVIPEVQI